MHINRASLGYLPGTHCWTEHLTDLDILSHLILPMSHKASITSQMRKFQRVKEVNNLPAVTALANGGGRSHKRHMINLPQSQKIQSRAARPGRSGEVQEPDWSLFVIGIEVWEQGEWLAEVTQLDQTTAVTWNLNQSHGLQMIPI